MSSEVNGGVVANNVVGKVPEGGTGGRGGNGVNGNGGANGHKCANGNGYLEQILGAPKLEPWPERVDGAQLLDETERKVTGHVVLPKWAGETITLWVPHTYCFQYRDITTYIGIESPEHRCGKSTLITILSELTHRAVVASNVTAPSFFRVIAQVEPTLLIDEADTFLNGNEELRGILNASYLRKTAFVLRAVNLPAESVGGSGEGEAEEAGAAYGPGVQRFSCWCPKCIARIGALPVTLADRCIVFRLQRKTEEEQCERLRKFRAGDLPRKWLRFALDNAGAIASAEPEFPSGLNDREADIWEPLLVIADLAGGRWPERARQAAVGVALGNADSNPMGVLLFDVWMQFRRAHRTRLFSAELVQGLNWCGSRPWTDLLRGRPMTERWLARQLGPYGIRSRTMRIGEQQAKGYCEEDVVEVVRRYVPKAQASALVDELRPAVEEPQTGEKPGPAGAVDKSGKGEG